MEGVDAKAAAPARFAGVALLEERALLGEESQRDLNREGEHEENLIMQITMRITIRIIIVVVISIIIRIRIIVIVILIHD